MASLRRRSCIPAGASLCRAGMLLSVGAPGVKKPALGLAGGEDGGGRDTSLRVSPTAEELQSKARSCGSVSSRAAFLCRGGVAVTCRFLSRCSSAWHAVLAASCPSLALRLAWLLFSSSGEIWREGTAEHPLPAAAPTCNGAGAGCRDGDCSGSCSQVSAGTMTRGWQ